MAKSFKYWVIVAGNTPTAFRSRTREPLLPTLTQLQRTQPNVTLSWFERNRLWTSPEQAEEEYARRGTMRRERKPEWRPGGLHKDPKARVELTRDQKRAKFKKQLVRRGRDESAGAVGEPGSVDRPKTSSISAGRLVQKHQKPRWSDEKRADNTRKPSLRHKKKP